MNEREQIIDMAVTIVKRSLANQHPVYGMHIHQLIGYAKQLHSIDEMACNRELESWEDMKRDTLLLKIRHIASEIGCTAYHQADPRGAPIYLIFPGDVPEGSEVASCYTNGVAIY